LGAEGHEGEWLWESTAPGPIPRHQPSPPARPGRASFPAMPVESPEEGQSYVLLPSPPCVATATGWVHLASPATSAATV